MGEAQVGEAQRGRSPQEVRQNVGKHEKKGTPEHGGHAS